MRTIGIVCAGGFGTLDAVDSKLQEVVGGLPLVVHPVKALIDSGAVDKIFVVVSATYQKQLMAGLSANLSEEDFQSLHFIKQYWRSGAAGAVSLVLPHLSDTVSDFVVVFGDMPLWRPQTIAALVDAHRNDVDAPVISMISLAVPNGHPAMKYGRIMRDEDGNIVGVYEPHEILSKELLLSIRVVNPSLYVFNKDFVDSALPEIQPRNKGDAYSSEFHLPHLVVLAVMQGRKIQELPLSDPDEALGVNTIEELALVRETFATRNRESS